MIGGSAGIEQQYWKAGSGNQGESSVTMTIMGESPMFQGMMRVFNPAIAGSAVGKFQKIMRNKAIVTYSADNRDGEIMINVDKKYLVCNTGFFAALKLLVSPKLEFVRARAMKI